MAHAKRGIAELRRATKYDEELACSDKGRKIECAGTWRGKKLPGGQDMIENAERRIA